MDEQVDKREARMLDTLRQLFPKAEMHRILDELAGRQISCHQFKTFVWHTMAKAATEKVAGRKWELVDADLRHKATQMAVIYAMHCIYERAAKGVSDLSMARKEAQQWTWGSKAG